MIWDFKPETRNKAYKAAVDHFTSMEVERTIADAVLDAIREDVAAEIAGTDRYIRVHDQARRKEESAHNETLAVLRMAEDRVTDLVIKIQFLIDNEVKVPYTFLDGETWYPGKEETRA